MTRPRISFGVMSCTSELTIVNAPIIAPPKRNNMRQLATMEVESAKPAIAAPRQINIVSAIRPLFRTLPNAATVSAPTMEPRPESDTKSAKRLRAAMENIARVNRQERARRHREECHTKGQHDQHFHRALPCE